MLRIITCACLVILLCCQVVLAIPEDELETSIVCLITQYDEVKGDTDYFFELLDMEDYVLVPVNALRKYLDYTANFDRESEELTVLNLQNGRSVRVNLRDKVYFLGERMEWSYQPPVMLDGDFYVSVLMIEYLSEITVNWEPKYQELTLTGEIFKKEAPSKGPSETTGEVQEQVEDAPQQVHTGPFVSLGSIQYNLLTEHRSSNEGVEGFGSTLDLFMHGRVGAWAVSAGGNSDYDYLTKEGDIDLSWIQARYREDDTLIILGDSALNLEETVGKKSIRGILYMQPDYQYNKLVAYTSVSGVAEEGDKVSLYVNEILRGVLYITPNKTYCFERVPLVIKRLNVIKVVVESPDGQRRETVKKIAASPRMLEANSKEVLAAVGKSRTANSDEWEGFVGGARTRFGINEDLTLSWETAVTKRDLEELDGDVLSYGSDLGVAFRVRDNTIFTLDWLVGGEDLDTAQSQTGQGVEAVLLYCVENGYLEAMYFYIQPNALKGVHGEPGKGVKVVGVYDFSRIWQVKASAKATQNTPEMLPFTLYSGDVTLTHKWGATLQHATSLTLLGSELTSEIDGGDERVETLGVSINQDSYQKGLNAECDLSYLHITTELSPLSLSAKTERLTLQADVTKSIDKALVGLKSQSVAVWENERYLGTQVEAEAEVKVGSGKTWVTGSASARGKDDGVTDSGFELDETRLSVNITYYLTDKLSTTGGAEVVHRYYSDQMYTTANAGATYRFNRQSRLSGEVGYVSPVGSRLDPQWSASVKLNLLTRADFEISLEAERIYDNLWDTEHEDVVRLELSHALGFAKGMVHGQRYSAEEHVSYVGGRVYLDENGNQLRDEGEKLLAGIPMVLDGKRATTNEDGEFLFNYVEPGMYRVNFDLRRLDANYTPVTEEKVLRIKENENLTFDFGLTLNGSISGQVFLDKNANGYMDDGDEPLSWVEITLDGDERSAYTTKDGNFYFENVPLGKHQVVLGQGSLPRNTVLTTPGVSEILITEEDLDTSGLTYPVVYGISN